MSSLVAIAALVNVAIVAFLIFQLRRLRAAYRVLQAETAGLVRAAEAVPPNLEDQVAAPAQRLIGINILNPMELAAQESWFAETFGGLAPPLIHKLVYERASKIVETKLQEHGVVAEVTIHRGR